MTAELAFHPLAEIFPLIEGEDFAALVADIKAHGVHEPIWIYQGQIIDGRNRYRAARLAGIDCPMREYIGDNPVAFVVSLNLKRRHLNESQRAMVAARLATLQRGDNQHSPIGETSQAQAAELLNVGKRSVERAREVRERGAPELQAAVERGQVSVSAAADIASETPEQQREIVARGEREILEAAKQIRGSRAEAKRNERIARIAAISNANAPLPQERKYPIILADPPWKFEVYDAESGLDHAADAHYPTMELADICKLPIAEIATPDAVLFMWTTAPHLPEAFEVLAAWGFGYCTHFAWVKDKVGLGYWIRNQHELLLIAKRGDPPTPKPGDRPPSVISAPRREHSRKPDEAYELIERMYSELPKIELFARHARPGWAAWGNQAPTNDGANIPDDLSIPPALRRSAS
jgi:N6-adenosine-specific RNA methylase IME4/ParB-like chromosome segregation protein Spo0J